MPVTQKRAGAGPFKYATAADGAHKAAFSAFFLRKKKERADLDALGFFFLLTTPPPPTTHTLHRTHTCVLVPLAGGRGQRLYDENVE